MAVRYSWHFAILVGLAFGATADKVRYDIICDAGSTGTRMYLFTSTFSTDHEGKETLQVSTEVIGKRKPGLSAYATNPEKSVPPLLELFSKVRTKIPHELWADTTVSVLGTAGMRSLAENQRQPIYDAVRKGLVASEDYVFPKGTQLKLRSLTGIEEGTFSMVCVNFLTGRLDHHLTLTEKGVAEKLVGILDLGGSSTQIAVPPENVHQQPFLGGAPFTVRSYAAYGMEQMRGRLDKHVVELGLASSPCYFKGYSEPAHGLLGSGEAWNCRKMLLEVFANSKLACIGRDNECMPGADNIVSEAGSRGIQFFAVSGYLFVTDFASHWLKRTGSTEIASLMQEIGNRPTIKELEKAADELCQSDWAEIERATAGGKDAGAHRYTDAVKAPHRCLEVNYVVTLLQHSYGFPGEQRFVTFEDEVDGNDVEWPLGALLHMRHQRGLSSGGDRGEL